MREGSLDAPTRHPVNYQDPEFTDWDKINEEMERVFDVCHGCRRCFNLCDSFPKLFDLIDESETGELDSVAKEDYKPVVDACTLCDMCFMVSCPYVPPHEFNIDFPHLMLRYRYAERVSGKVKDGLAGELTKTDRNGELAAKLPGLANWASDTKNGMTRGALEKIAGVDRQAKLPKFHGKTFKLRAKNEVPEVNQEAPGHGRKAILYATCFVNYNNPDIGMAARKVLAKNGVETEVVYPACCGMPQLEQGDFPKVAENAKRVSAELLEWVEKGYDVIALVPSCALMLKFEWPLILPEDENIKKLASATYDITEYVVDIAKNEGIAEGMKPLDGTVAFHVACHARAQNMGAKGAEMLRLIPETKPTVIQRCSGHGGSWGVMKGNFETALKVGKPAIRQAAKPDTAYLASECPLAGDHLVQGIERLEAEDKPKIEQSSHPIELLAKAYGF